MPEEPARHQRAVAPAADDENPVPQRARSRRPDGHRHLAGGVQRRDDRAPAAAHHVRRSGEGVRRRTAVSPPRGREHRRRLRAPRRQGRPELGARAPAGRPHAAVRVQLYDGLRVAWHQDRTRRHATRHIDAQRIQACADRTDAAVQRHPDAGRCDRWWEHLRAAIEPCAKAAAGLAHPHRAGEGADSGRPRALVQGKGRIPVRGQRHLQQRALPPTHCTRTGTG